MPSSMRGGAHATSHVEGTNFQIRIICIGFLLEKRERRYTVPICFSSDCNNDTCFNDNYNRFRVNIFVLAALKGEKVH